MLQWNLLNTDNGSWNYEPPVHFKGGVRSLAIIRLWEKIQCHTDDGRK